MKILHLGFLSSPIALALGITSGAAIAQDASEGASDARIGEIIVTAQKRAQSISDIGMTINVADADVLVKQGVVELGDLTKVVSGFSAQVNGDGTPIFSIRGINFNAQNLAVSPTIAVSIDEAPLPYAVMAQGAILDLERVEVLKGPQGTLYGQNATGGTINLIAAKPTDDLSYGGQVSYGRFETLDMEGFVSGPLSDTLKGRLAFSATSSGPWQYSTSRPDDETGRQSKFAGRMLLDWEATDKFHLSLNLNGWVDKSETLQPQVVNYRPANPAGTACEITPGCGFPADGPNPFVNIGKARAADWWPEFPTLRNNNFYQASLRADYDLNDNLQLTSLSTYSRVKIDSFFSGSGYPIPVQDQNFTGSIKAFNQELRLSGQIPDSGIHFIVGANYSYDKSNQVDHWFDTLNSATAPAFTLFDNRTKQRGRSYAAFVSMDWDITDKLSLSAGIRYTDSKRTATSCTHDVDGAAAATFNFLIDAYRTGALNPATALTPAEMAAYPFTPIGQGECFTIGPRENGYRPYKDPVTLHQDNVPWRLNLNYKFSRDLTVYTTVSRGFKDGVFPAKTAASYVTYVPVGQEQLTAYEAGFKAQAFNRTLSLNAAVFYYDYKDKQLVPSFDDPVFRLVSATANIPKSKVTGFDMDVTWRPVEVLTLKSNLTYADSKVVSHFPDYLNTPDLTGGGALPLVDDKGNSFNLSPKWTSISDAELRLPVSSNAETFFGATVTYNSVTWSDLAHSPSVQVDPFTLLDLRAGVSFDSGLDVMVWGKNVTNKYYWGLAYGQGDSTVRYANMPVTYGITLRFKH